ncbi:hypothetical protein PAPYR_5212 [Paratrimastix pyriformis]|uniref:Uncharacterized protein n=1 Tax=Paratrimastix pyriformis TaxID=342808 RepID=A0ABQ8UN63_9EUKA|nr:hypothetical protein PAPYR_5212 [Paratrimastix pyriformis]
MISAKNDDEVVRGQRGSCQLLFQTCKGASVTIGFDSPISAAELTKIIRTRLVPIAGIHSKKSVPIQPNVLQVILEHEELELADFFAKVENSTFASRPKDRWRLRRCRRSFRDAVFHGHGPPIEGSTYTLGETSLAVLSGIAAPAGKPGFATFICPYDLAPPFHAVNISSTPLTTQLQSRHCFRSFIPPV